MNAMSEDRAAVAASQDEESTPARRLSARASRADAVLLTDEEIEAAEREAEEWARRVNRC